MDTGKAFKGKDEVAIGGFKVTFVTRQKGSTKPRGSFLGGNSVARASATAVLQGVDRATMQRITDEAYEDFITRLEDKGYRVRPYSLLRKNAAFAKVKTRPSPLETDEPLPAWSADALIFAPTGRDLRLFAGQGAGLQGLGWSSPESGFSKAAVETGVPVIDVHYVIGFATFGGHQSRTTSSVNVDQQMAVNKGSRVFITSGYGGTFSSDQGWIKLGRSVGGNHSFSTIEKQERSASQKVGSVVAAGAAVLLGGGTRSSGVYQFRADSEQYELAALDSLGKASEGLLDTMASLR